ISFFSFIFNLCSVFFFFFFFFFSSRRRHTRFDCDWSSDVCSSDLRPGDPRLGELDVDLQADDRLPVAQARTPLPSKPMLDSSAWAASRIRFSENAGPTIWKPVGRPSLRPSGMEIAGIPASGIGTVKKSLRYIARGSSVLAP